MFSFLSRRLFSNLYTWGSSTSSLGYETSTTTTSVSLPKLLDFQTPIEKCVLGPNHSAILTKSGDVYTFGSGAYGALGHDNEDKSVLPKQISSLSKLEIKVKDIAVGGYHTVILTTEGEVWTMGYGGDLAGGWMRNLFSQKGGGLGHGDLSNRFVPSLILSLKSIEDIKLISAGNYHSIAVGESGAVYVWGKGEMGVLGTGKNKTLLNPCRNEIFEDLRSREILIKKIQTYNYSNIALMNNGKILSWGWNEVGQLALGNYARADMYDTESKPTEPDFFKDLNVVDFELGEECSVFRTDEDRIFYAGIRLHREPIELNVPSDTKVKGIFACKKVGGYVTEDNRVFANGNLFASGMMEEDIQLRMWKVKSKAFMGLTVDRIGGQSVNHFCFLS